MISNSGRWASGPNFERLHKKSEENLASIHFSVTSKLHLIAKMYSTWTCVENYEHAREACAIEDGTVENKVQMEIKKSRELMDNNWKTFQLLKASLAILDHKRPGFYLNFLRFLNVILIIFSIYVLAACSNVNQSITNIIGFVLFVQLL